MQKPTRPEHPPQQLAGWLSLNSGAKLFHWLHKPAHCSRLAVVITSPIGPEYMHCQRAVKQLAEKLASLNIATIRFDHVGYGNSTGSAFDQRLVEQWRDTLGDVTSLLKTQPGVEKIGIVSLRSGSLLTSKLFSSDSGIDYLVYWYPYSQGAAFKRDMEIIDQLLDTAVEYQTDYINAGGYPLTRESAESLESFMLKNIIHQVRQALVISPSDSARNNRITSQLSASGVACDEESFASLPKMARQAELSELPSSDIEAISCWLSARSGNFDDNNDIDHIPDTTLNNSEYVESVVDSGTRPHLFGIYCRPAPHLNCRNCPLVVLTNAGAGHNVGPNRLHVDLARKLAKAGIESLRFDLSNLGDSPQFEDPGNNYPYPDHALDDIDRMLNEIACLSATNRFVIAGLCSGAYNAFHAQHELTDHNIEETILINPLTFYIQPGESVTQPDASKTTMEKNYYRSQARDWRIWLGLITSPRKILNVSLFIWRYLVEKAKSWLRRFGMALGFVKPAQLHRDIKSVLLHKRKISFFVSENDPGYDMIMREAGSLIRDNLDSGNITIKKLPGDHTFSTLDSRNTLINSICEHLKNRYGTNE